MSGRARLAGAGMLALFVLLVILDARLRRAGAGGVLDLELAGSEAAAREIVDRWAAGTARLYLALDTLFIPFAAVFWWSTARALTSRARGAGRRRIAAAGRVVTPLPWAIGVLDLVENVALLLLVEGVDGAAPAAVAAICSVPTLVLAPVVIAYAAVAYAAVGRSAPTRRSSAA